MLRAAHGIACEVACAKPVLTAHAMALAETYADLKATALRQLPKLHCASQLDDQGSRDIVRAQHCNSRWALNKTPNKSDRAREGRDGQGRER